jgi:hypothetical protein
MSEGGTRSQLAPRRTQDEAHRFQIKEGGTKDARPFRS